MTDVIDDTKTFTVQVQGTGNQYYVSTGGSDSNNGLSTTTAWRHIQYAANNVTAGDTVNIMGGTYSEGQITINNKHGTSSAWITIQPYGTDVVNLDGTNVPYIYGASAIKIQYSEYVRVTGLNILNSAWWGIGIWKEANYIRVDHCYVYNSSGMAIHPTPEGSGLLVQHITIDHNIVDLANTNWSWTGGSMIPGYGGEAISLANVHYFEVAYNQISRCGKECIDTKSGSEYGSVHHNTVDTSTWVGEPGYNGDNNGIPNGIPYNHLGIYCDGYSLHARYIDIYNNYVYGDHGGGIFLNAEQPGGSVDHVKVYNNVVDLGWDSARGISLGYSQPMSYLEIYNNTVITNQNATFSIAKACINISNIIVKNNIFMVRSTGYYALTVYGFNYPISPSILILSNNLFWRENKTSPNNTWLNGDNLGWGDNAIIANPLFVGANDYHLQSNSPAVNTGAVVPLAFDYDDNPRPIGGYDIGAYEAQM
jgi:hypothetical protein